MHQSTRVLIVDDHEIIRHELAMMLMGFADLQLVGEAQNGVETMEICKAIQPDVVLIDLLLPDMNSIEITQSILKNYPSTQVIVLTSWDEYQLVQRALAIGANNYLLKNSNPEELAVSIREAHPIGRQSHSKMVSDADLTDRELAVLKLMIAGLTNNQIAVELVISRATVKFHVSSILSKMNAASRTEAVAMAVQSDVDGPSG